MIADRTGEIQQLSARLSESKWRRAKESGRQATEERPGLLTGCCSRSKVESGPNLAGNWCNRVHFSTAFIQVSAARSTRCLKRVSSMTFFSAENSKVIASA